MDVIQAVDTNGALLGKFKKHGGNLIIAVVTNDANPLISPFINGVNTCANSKGIPCRFNIIASTTPMTALNLNI